MTNRRRRRSRRQSPLRQRPSLVSRLGPCISIVEAVALFAAVLGLLATLGESFDGAPL
jgi:hypothetical protein